MMVDKHPIRAGQYCELHAHSCYSLLDGVPTPEQLVERAAQLGMPAIALTDHDAVYGVVPFYLRAKELGLTPILGAELTLEDDSHLTLLCETNSGYANLCRLITAGRLNAPKGESRLAWNVLEQHASGLLCLTGCRRGPVARHVVENDMVAAKRWLSYLVDIFGQNSVYVELQRNLGRDDVKISRRLAALAAERGLPCVATGNTHYLSRDDGDLQSALVSIRERVPLPRAGHLLRPNHEYFMRSAQGMLELFPDLPEAVMNTAFLAERCNTSLPTDLQSLSMVATPDGMTADEYLRQLCIDQLPRYYPPGRDGVRALLDKELSVIHRLGLANYFLVIWDLVEFCRQRNILCHGHGAAAHSLVSRLLGITAVDSIEQTLAAENFISLEHGGAPHIGLDIEALHRESVIQYVCERWGYDHVETACRFITIRSASAIREAGFALGFDQEAIDKIAPADDVDPQPVESEGEEVRCVDTPLAHLAGELRAQAAHLASDEWQCLVRLAQRLQGRPREVGVHTGALVITGDPIADLAPVEPAAPDGFARTVVQFDKEGIESLNLVRVDLHAQGMLSAITDTLMLVRDTRQRPMDLRQLDYQDKAVYDLICSARTIGVVQEDLGTQPSLVPCMQPHCFQDLVVEATLMLRPSPLRRGMVQHYRRRRQGLEPVTYVQPLLRPALEETLGVLIFQEQVIQIARDVAGFTLGRSELLRRALDNRNATEAVERFKPEFIEGALLNNISFPTAEQIWNMLTVFAVQSCSKSQAIGFATIIYWAAWLRLKHPTEYFCGQLRFAPPASYPARVLESEARRAGVKFLAFDVNRSKAKPTVERGAIRFGLSHINGIDESTAEAILLARGNRPFRTLADLIQRTRLDRRALEWLVLAGALDSFGARPHVLWELAEAFAVARRPQAPAPDILDDYGDMDGLNYKPRLINAFAATSHAAQFRLTEVRRDAFTRAGCLPWNGLRRAWVGTKVKVGGLVADGVRRPPDAKGAAFMRIAEPEGSIEVIIPETVYLDYRDALQSAFLIVEGTVKSQGAVVTIVARKVQALA